MTRLDIALVSAATILGAGCNEIAGINEPVTRKAGETGGLFDVTPFIGNWSNNGGKLTLACGGGAETIDNDLDITVTRGASSDLLISDENCAIRFNATAARTAAIVPGEACVIQTTFEDEPATQSYEFSSASFEVSADGLAANDKLEGSFTVRTPTRVGTCQFVQTDSYRKAQ